MLNLGRAQSLILVILFLAMICHCAIRQIITCCLRREVFNSQTKRWQGYVMWSIVPWRSVLMNRFAIRCLWWRSIVRAVSVGMSELKKEYSAKEPVKSSNNTVILLQMSVCLSGDGLLLFGECRQLPDCDHRRLGEFELDAHDRTILQHKNSQRWPQIAHIWIEQAQDDRCTDDQMGLKLC
jgi:hypothetical protein